MAELEQWGLLTDLAQQNLCGATEPHQRIISADVLCRQLRHLCDLLEQERRHLPSGKMQELDKFVHQLSEAARACDDYVRSVENGEPGRLPKPLDCAELKRFLTSFSRRRQESRL